MCLHRGTHVGWPLQAQEHAAKAQASIPFCSPEAAGEEKAAVQECYFTVYYTQGKSALLLGKYPLNELRRI